MRRFDGLVLQEQRHLKWRVLDPLENLLMILCGIVITAFSVLVLCDIVTRAIGHPWLWLQETTMDFFIYGTFIGVAAATRRNDHLYFEMFNRFVVLCVALCMVYFGYLNVLDGFKSLRMPSMTPMAYLYIAIPICGALVALFTVEQMVNGWRKGFPDIPIDERRTSL
jgi:TRAP-type C4-dicarboxylate transport system permease small subunit